MLKRLYYRLLGRWRDLRVDLQPDAERERNALVVWKRATSPDLFYVFQGRGRRRGAPAQPHGGLRLTMEPMSFFHTTGLIDANLVLLRDYNRFFYHAGINSDLGDVDAIRAHLAACREQMPHVRRTYCLGTSMGGYAALLFGHYLRADVVYAFAPQTLLDLKRLGAMARRRDTWRFPEAHRDLALLLADYNGHTRYKVYYCEGAAQDRAFAERLGGLGGVELYPQPGDSHAVIQEMDRHGRLADVLPVSPEPLSPPAPPALPPPISG